MIRSSGAVGFAPAPVASSRLINAVAASLARGESVTATSTSSGVSVVAVPVILVTAENVQPILIDSGFHAASVLPSCTHH